MTKGPKIDLVIDGVRACLIYIITSICSRCCEPGGSIDHSVFPKKEAKALKFPAVLDGISWGHLATSIVQVIVSPNY